ncbi:MAG TPA: polysaccharide biosynthesis/export family protein [Syntrophales bacterium]|nr:polysaccharide biosynthesis/export family protein [Syntrophales bacterium]HPC31333.1 polysaccharide biosynthesis/export family protein [Syntrophales bacterium]HRR45966.1 polysaccharide biosynthesis/export family protein [Syntrophales bacterium]HRU87453.1 polysaccharide biosynthesis/export family protein [Syntrophales bacterium]
MEGIFRRVWAAIFLVLLTCSLTACFPFLEDTGIPITEYDLKKITPEEEARLQKEHQERLAELAKLSRVKSNSVFTEKRGVADYIVGPGDVLTVNFWTIAVAGAQTFEGFKQITYNVEVRPDGKISYMYGDDIPVNGKTVYEIQELLRADLKKYFRNPRLEVLVKEYKSKTATLFGQINVLPTGTSGPGRYPLTGKTTMIDLISKAGGAITGRSDYSSLPGSVAAGQQNVANADLKNVELLRKGKKYTVNLYSAMFYGDEKQNPVIDDGDIITVPALPFFADRIYVMGQVANVGIYRLQDAPDLLAALAQAGSITPLAVKSDIKVIREFRERGGKPIILSANYNDILKRGDLSQNIKLQSGDVVYVPRMFIGDINEFIANTTPLLNYLLIPASYRDKYFKDQSAMKW